MWGFFFSLLSIHFCRSSRRIRFGIGMRRRRSRMKGRNNNDKQFPVIPRQTKDSPAEETSARIDFPVFVFSTL